MENEKLTREECEKAKSFKDLVNYEEEICVIMYEDDKHSRTMPILNIMRKYNGSNLTFETRVIVCAQSVVKGRYFEPKSYTKYKNKKSYVAISPFGFNDDMLKEFARVSLDKCFTIYFETSDSDPWGFRIDKNLKIVDRWQTSPGG